MPIKKTGKTIELTTRFYVIFLGKLVQKSNRNPRGLVRYIGIKFQKNGKTCLVSRSIRRIRNSLGEGHFLFVNPDAKVGISLFVISPFSCKMPQKYRRNMIIHIISYYLTGYNFVQKALSLRLSVLGRYACCGYFYYVNSMGYIHAVPWSVCSRCFSTG